MLLQPYGKNGDNVPHYSDFFFVIMNYDSYILQNEQFKVPNLVYFGSPSIALFNGNRTITI